MTEFQPGQPAAQAHLALKSALETMEKAKRCAVLWFGEILERRLYQELGYGSINQYAKVELGFSTSRTGDFLQLCRRLKKLPKVKEQVAGGKLGYTKARVVASVADETNEAEWVDLALSCSRRELEQQVKLAKSAASETRQPSLLPVPGTRPAAVVPVRVSLELSPTQFARYEALWEKIRKQRGVPADKAEALLAIMAAFTAESSPRGELAPPVQIHIHQCPDCEKATVQTGKGELEISAAELDQAACDCRTQRPGERNTSAIPPATRRQVLARDRYKCQAPGCTHTHYLEIHHKVLRAKGGTNHEDNLLTLCSACHRLRHRQGASTAREPVVVYQHKSSVTAGVGLPVFSIQRGQDRCPPQKNTPPTDGVFYLSCA